MQFNDAWEYEIIVAVFLELLITDEKAIQADIAEKEINNISAIETTTSTSENPRLNFLVKVKFFI